MHTCIPLHGLKRSWHSCPRWENASHKNTPSMHHPRKQNVTTSMVGLKNDHIRKYLTQMVNPRDKAGNAEDEEEDTMYCLCPWFALQLDFKSGFFLEVSVKSFYLWLKVSSPSKQVLVESTCSTAAWSAVCPTSLPAKQPTQQSCQVTLKLAVKPEFPGMA